MKQFYLYCDRENQKVYIEGRYARPSTIAPYRNLVLPGGKDAGLTYDELIALGTGVHEIPAVGKKVEQAPAA